MLKLDFISVSWILYVDAFFFHFSHFVFHLSLLYFYLFIPWHYAFFRSLSSFGFYSLTFHFIFLVCLHACCCCYCWRRFFLFYCCSFYLSAKKKNDENMKRIFFHIFFSISPEQWNSERFSVKWMELSGGGRDRASGRNGKKKFENSIRIINRNELNRHNWCLCTIFGLLKKISWLFSCCYISSMIPHESSFFVQFSSHHIYTIVMCVPVL